MKHKLLLWLCLASSAACIRAPGPVTYVPPKEAAWFKLPHELPEQGREELSGEMVAAIQLAMDDFLPWNIQPPWGATPQEICLHQRQSYDVHAAPHGEGVMLVRITSSPGACTWGKNPIMDEGATYAVDTRSWRILAVRRP
jgi:hypothetical protein